MSREVGKMAAKLEFEEGSTLGSQGLASGAGAGRKRDPGLDVLWTSALTSEKSTLLPSLELVMQSRGAEDESSNLWVYCPGCDL